MDSAPSPRSNSESGLQVCVRTISKGSRFLGNATLLRCPVCGKHPLFVPLNRVKTLYDWSIPLDGCPQCGFPYDREAGYFLFAVWSFSYIASVMIGFAVYLTLSVFTSWAFTGKLSFTIGVMFFSGGLLLRHAKAYFIALDHFLDPHISEKKTGNS